MAVVTDVGLKKQRTQEVKAVKSWLWKREGRPQRSLTEGGRRQWAPCMLGVPCPVHPGNGPLSYLTAALSLLSLQARASRTAAGGQMPRLPLGAPLVPPTARAALSFAAHSGTHTAEGASALVSPLPGQLPGLASKMNEWIPRLWPYSALGGSRLSQSLSTLFPWLLKHQHGKLILLL